MNEKYSAELKSEILEILCETLLDGDSLGEEITFEGICDEEVAEETDGNVAFLANAAEATDENTADDEICECSSEEPDEPSQNQGTESNDEMTDCTDESIGEAVGEKDRETPEEAFDGEEPSEDDSANENTDASTVPGEVDCDDSESEQEAEDITVEFYGKTPDPSTAILYDYCEGRGLSEIREITDRLLCDTRSVSGDELRRLALAYGLSAHSFSRLLSICGFEPLRHKALCDTVFGAVLGTSRTDGVARKEPDEYLCAFEAIYAEAVGMMTQSVGDADEDDGDGNDNVDEKKTVYAPTRGDMYCLTAGTLEKYLIANQSYFIERSDAILEKYHSLMTVFAELYDNTAINCKWTEAEGEYCLRSFIERFCTALPQKNSYTELTVKKIGQGRLPTRELMTVLFLYELCLAGTDSICYKGKGKGSKKVTKELSAAISEKDGVMTFNPRAYFGSRGGKILSGEELVYYINTRLMALGYLPLNENLRFDSAFLALRGLEITVRNGGRSVAVCLDKKDGKPLRTTLDISSVASTVSPLLAAVFLVLEGDGTEEYPLACELNELA